MKYQRGMSLTSLLFGGAFLFLIALLGMKITPAWIEYGTIKRDVAATAQDISLKDANLTQVRNAFSKRAEIDAIKDISADDLDITKDGNGLVIEFAYTKKVPLGGNVSLVFDFSGSSQGKSNAQ